MIEQELLEMYETLIDSITSLRKETEEIKVLYKSFKNDIAAAKTQVEKELADVLDRVKEIDSLVDDKMSDFKSIEAKSSTLKNIGNIDIPKKTIKDYFESQGFKVIDKRPNGGKLWVVGEEEELKEYVAYVNIVFKADGSYGSGRATGYRPGWYTASDK